PADGDPLSQITAENLFRSGWSGELIVTLQDPAGRKQGCTPAVRRGGPSRKFLACLDVFRPWLISMSIDPVPSRAIHYLPNVPVNLVATLKILCCCLGAVELTIDSAVRVNSPLCP